MRYLTTPAALALGGLLLSSWAQAYTNPAAQATIKAAPTASQNHSLQVKLDAKGDWSVVPSTTVKLRFAYTHHWNPQPDQNKSLWARIYVGQANNHKGGENYYDKSQMFDLSSAQVMAANGTLSTNLPFSLLVTDGIPGPNVATYCSFEKDKRLKQGKTLNQVLRYGFNVQLKTPLRLVGFYEMGGGGSRPPSSHQYVVETDAPVTIQCLGNPALADQLDPPKGPQSLAAPFQINSVDLQAVGMKQQSVCPLEVSLKANLKGLGSGQIQYWLEQVGAGGAALKQVTQLGGQAGKQGNWTLAFKVKLTPDAPAPQQDIGGIKSNQQGTWVKRSYRFHVLAPSKVQSQVLNLELLCTSTLKAGQAAQGQVIQQAQPQPPKPQPPIRAPEVKPQPPQGPQQIKAPSVDPQPPQSPQQLRAPASDPQPPKPALKLQAVPVEPPPPAGTVRAPQ